MHYRRDHLRHNAGVPHADLSAARWRELSDESAVSVARVIARENQLDLVEARGHDYAGRHQRVALFERAGMRFSLVSAGHVVLGYGGAGFVPSPGQAASYAESAEEYGLPAITEFIDSMTSPRRAAELPAMLVAVEALRAGVTPVAAGDPRAHEWTTEAGIVCGGDGGGATCGGAGFFLGSGRLLTCPEIDRPLSPGTGRISRPLPARCRPRSSAPTPTSPESRRCDPSCLTSSAAMAETS